MYKLRKAIEKEMPELYPKIAQLKLSLLMGTNSNTWNISFEPADTSFDQALDTAGINIPDAPELDYENFTIPDDET